MTDEPTDYTTMSGAQFKRRVGADPEKWAREFCAVMAGMTEPATEAERIAFIATWFRDAMDAAVKASTQ